MCFTIKVMVLKSGSEYIGEMAVDDDHQTPAWYCSTAERETGEEMGRKKHAWNRCPEGM